MNCLQCQKLLTKSQKKYCSRSCAATANNTGIRRHSKPLSRWSLVKKCLTCGTESHKKYCSDTCNPRRLNMTPEEKQKYIRAKKNEAWQRYMAKKKNQTPPNADIKAMQQFYLNCPIGYEVDHIIPLSKGGLHSIENLQYLTISENRKKSNKLMAPPHGDDPRSSVLETDVLPT